MLDKNIIFVITKFIILNFFSLYQSFNNQFFHLKTNRLIKNEIKIFLFEKINASSRIVMD